MERTPETWRNDVNKLSAITFYSILGAGIALYASDAADILPKVVDERVARQTTELMVGGDIGVMTIWGINYLRQTPRTKRELAAVVATGATMGAAAGLFTDQVMDLAYGEVVCNQPCAQAKKEAIDEENAASVGAWSAGVATAALGSLLYTRNRRLLEQSSRSIVVAKNEQSDKD